jgi:DNA-directed RNA polymerase subunit RPC12/RpoP
MNFERLYRDQRLLGHRKSSKKRREYYAGDIKWRCDVKSFGGKRMALTLIIICTRCSGLFLAADHQKTRTCPYCSTRVDVRKAKKVASAPNVFEASEMLRKIKSRKGFSRK